MSTLYLVRHGQASAGTDDYDRLSELGRTQATLLGQWWAKQEFNADFSYHGSLSRQRDTALLSLGQLGPTPNTIVHEGLNEYDHDVVDAEFANGVKSDDPDTLTFEDYLGIMRRWRDATETANQSKAEPWLDFQQRGWHTVKELHSAAQNKGNHVFFTSGGVIACIVSVILDLNFVHTIDAIWRIRNSSITTLHFDGSNARLIDFNTVPHLQSHHDASLITLI